MNKQGYTLLEVTLFMAISGLLALIAMTSLGPRFRNVRFTSGMRELQTAVSKNAGDLTKGVNARSGTVRCQSAPPAGGGTNAPSINTSSSAAGSSEACVVNGRLFLFESDKLTTYTITSLREPTTAGCANSTSTDAEAKKFQDLVSCYRPSLLSQPPINQAPYQSGITYTKTEGNNTFDYTWKGLGYLIDPATNQSYAFIYKPNTAPCNPATCSQILTNQTALHKGGDGSGSIVSYKPSFCFSLGSRYASLSADTVNSQVKLNFEDSICQ